MQNLCQFRCGIPWVDPNIDLAIRAHTVLCLAEMSERLSLTLLFDEKSRRISTGDGRDIAPISYDSMIPTPGPV